MHINSLSVFYTFYEKYKFLFIHTIVCGNDWIKLDLGNPSACFVKS